MGLDHAISTRQFPGLEPAARTAQIYLSQSNPHLPDLPYAPPLIPSLKNGESLLVRSNRSEKMGRLAVTLVVLFLSSAALSGAAEFPENGVSTGDLPSTTAESTDTIPADSGDSDGSKQPDNEIRTLESNEVTTVTFRPAEHRLDGPPMMPVSFRPPFRLCRHCPRRVIPYGNDMILGSDSEGGLDPARWTQFHHRRHHHLHHGKPEFEEKGQMFQMKWHNDDSDDSDDDDDDLDHYPKRLHHGRRHFKREDDEEKHDGRHHHHHDNDDDDDDDDRYPKRFHHGGRQFKREDDEEKHDHGRRHHHHHHHKDDEEENGGFLAKFRKFLMDRF